MEIIPVIVLSQTRIFRNRNGILSSIDITHSSPTELEQRMTQVREVFTTSFFGSSLLYTYGSVSDLVDRLAIVRRRLIELIREDDPRFRRARTVLLSRSFSSFSFSTLIPSNLSGRTHFAVRPTNQPSNRASRRRVPKFIEPFQWKCRQLHHPKA